MRRRVSVAIFLALAVGFGMSSAVLAEAQPAPPPSGCIACHGRETRDYEFSRMHVTTKMVQGHGPALEHKLSECGDCHSIEYRQASQAQKPESWTQISQGLTCPVCHADHTKGEKPGDREKPTCASCHSALARNIGLGAPGVYNPQGEVWQGIAPAFLETASVPNRHPAHTCANCHFPKVSPDRRSHTLSPYLPNGRELACGQIGCHGDGEKYTDLARSWQREIAHQLTGLRGQLATKKPLTASNAGNLKNYNIAKYEVDLIAGDLSYGVHNIDFARAMLAEAQRHLVEIK